MRKIVIDFLKGIPIGISNVIPGFSGGTMAVILNIYERFINVFSDFFSHPIKIFKDVWALMLGIAVGIIFAIKVITLLLTAFPIPTIMFFIGLIIGSIPEIFDKARKNYKTKGWDVVIFFICVTVVIALPFLKSEQVNLNVDLKVSVLIFFLAVISSATMVIPGVSGSLILIALGYYKIVWVDIIGAFTDSLATFNLSSIISAIGPVIPFALGVIVGIVLISKIIKMLMKKYPQTVYYAILGLLFASPFAIMFGMFNPSGEYYAQISNTNLIGWIIGIGTLAIGAYLVNYLSQFDEAKKNEQTQKS